ncbi:CopG family transcriptional regulator [Archaeoglobales archaeon]|nr:MAG: CopG family transcriptional regulator [Archaeoglobales archaeon]
MVITRESRRITVSLDDEIFKMLEELSKKDGKTVSEVVRCAISNYYRITSKNIESEVIETLYDLLLEREHVIVDVGLWTAILEELNKKAEDDFWKIVGEIGREYGILLKRKGLKEVNDVLKYFESENWYRVKTISNDTYVLVLTVKAEAKILSVFLQNVFKVLEISVEIFEGWRKLIVAEKLLNDRAELVRKYLD